MEIKQNKDLLQFQLNVEDHTAYIVYEIKNDKIFLTSTQVPDELSGRGIGSKLVQGTLEQIEKMKLKVVPVCPFIEGWFKRHPEKEHLLA
jgi:predicted GNAT family acetyltransferase